MDGNRDNLRLRPNANSSDQTDLHPPDQTNLHPSDTEDPLDIEDPSDPEDPPPPPVTAPYWVKDLVKVYSFYMLVLVCCVIAPVFAAPILFMLHAVVRYLQLYTRDDPCEIVAQLRIYECIISFAYLFFLVVCAFTCYVIMPSISEQGILIETLINYWLDISLTLVMTLLTCEWMVGPVKNKMLVKDTRAAVWQVNLVICLHLMLARIFGSFDGLAESAGYQELLYTKWGGVALLLLLCVVIVVYFVGKFGRLLLRKIRQIIDNQDAAAADANSVLQYRLLHGNYMVFYAKRLKERILFDVIPAISLCVHRVYSGSYEFKTTTAEAMNKENLWQQDLTLILIIIWSLASLATRCHKLSREARTVYNRYDSRITKAGKDLYFLGILGRHTYDIFDIRYKTQLPPSNSRLAQTLFNITPSVERYYRTGRGDAEDKLEGGTNHATKLLSIRKREVYKNKLFLQEADRPLTLHDLRKASQCFLEARGQLSKKTYTSDIYCKLRPFVENEDGRSIRQKLKQLVNGKINRDGEVQDSDSRDWDSFEELLRTVDSSQDISLAIVKTWMERAHNNCLSLANLLHNAMEAVNHLDKIIYGLLIVGCFITYLVVKEIVNTAQLGIIIASPLVPAFVLRDTCKAMIQGMRFIYTMHPFDVGDLCVLDDNMMVVKSFDIWKTTFTMVENVVATGEEVIYSNSELAGKKITNHKTEFDWKDCVEFKVPCSVHGKEIEELKRQITEYLDEKEGEYTLDSYSIGESSMADNSPLKIAIHFRYNGHNTQHWTYIECLRLKKKLNWDFYVHVRDLVKNIGNQRHDQNSATREEQDNVPMTTGDDGISNVR